MFQALRCVLHYDTLLLPMYVYCLSKLVLQLAKNEALLIYTMFTMLRLLMTIFLTPIIFFLIISFALWTDIVRYIGIVYFGKKFVEFSSGGDALYSGDDRFFKGVIPVVCYIEENSPETLELLTQHIKTVSRKMQKNHPRLQCIQRQFLGYLFFLMDNTLGLDFITFLDDYDNEAEFQKVLNEKIGSSLPLNNKFLWDVTIGKRTVIVRNKKCIPILFRLHHSLGDGITLMALLTTNYIDNGCENIRIICENVKQLGGKPEKNNENHRKDNVFEDCLKFLMKTINILWNCSFYFGFDLIKGGEKLHNWHGEASGDISLKLIGCEKDGKFLEKIKTIKRKMKVSFNDIVLGVIAACFTKHFVDNRQAIPSKIITANPYNMTVNNVNHLLTFNAKNEPITNLGNKFTVGMYAIPLKEDYLKDPKSFIIEQHKITDYVKKSIDMQFMYWVIHTLRNITPLPIMLSINKILRPSTLVTNLPPMPAGRIIDHQIVDMTITGVHSYECSTCFAIYSYDGIFHISTMMDTACVDIQQQTAFGDNMVQFVNEIYNELL